AVLHLALPDELGQPLRPQRQLDDGLVGQDFGGGDLGAGHGYTVPGTVGGGHARPPRRNIPEDSPNRSGSVLSCLAGGPGLCFSGVRGPFRPAAATLQEPLTLPDVGLRTFRRELLDPAA